MQLALLFLIAPAVAVLSLGACAPRAETPPAQVSQAAPDVPAGAYTLDKAHATLLFRVNHLGFSMYTSRFSSWDATLQFDPANPGAAVVSATIDPASLETENPPPGFNEELRGPAWLDAAQFPQMTFKSTGVTVTGANTARIAGDLTLHGVTAPVTLDATFNGGYRGHPMDPNARIGFSARGTLNRSAFGVTYGIPAPGTTMGVGDAVEVIIEAEFTGPPMAGVAPR